VAKFRTADIPAELREQLGVAAPSKFRSKRTEVDGVAFDSKREAGRWVELRLLERAGRISGLRRQVRFPLTVNGQLVATYVADFVFEENGETVVEDAKGVCTRDYLLKRKLMKAVHGVEVREV
jgi:hypothetical protein